jgi:hypothetical protein
MYQQLLNIVEELTDLHINLYSNYLKQVSYLCEVLINKFTDIESNEFKILNKIHTNPSIIGTSNMLQMLTEFYQTYPENQYLLTLKNISMELQKFTLLVKNICQTKIQTLIRKIQNNIVQLNPYITRGDTDEVLFLENLYKTPLTYINETSLNMFDNLIESQTVPGVPGNFIVVNILNKIKTNLKTLKQTTDICSFIEMIPMSGGKKKKYKYHNKKTKKKTKKQKRKLKKKKSKKKKTKSKSKSKSKSKTKTKTKTKTKSKS